VNRFFAFLHFQVNLGKPLETFVVLSYFNYFCLICSLQTAKSLHFANKPDLQRGVEYL